MVENAKVRKSVDSRCSLSMNFHLGQRLAEGYGGFVTATRIVVTLQCCCSIGLSVVLRFNEY